MRNCSTTDLNFAGVEQAIHTYECNGNKFNISSLNEYYSPVDASGFAIKYVAEGVERYTVEGQPYLVDAGSYLLLNGNKSAAVEIDSKTDAKGICISISSQLIQEAVASIQQPGTAYADQELASFFYTDHFLENQYRTSHTILGRKIESIRKNVQQRYFSVNDIQVELFYDLAEKLVLDQVPVFKQLQSIDVVKTRTKNDLCRRLLRAREYMDVYYALPLSIEQVAREAAMSEFHFFRLFKKVFSITPHQYIMQKRLEASRLLLEEESPVTSVAIECGFSDIFSFSKAFKKQYGMAPSQVRGTKYEVRTA